MALFRDPDRQAEFDENGYLLASLLHTDEVSSLMNLYQDTLADAAKQDLYESSRHCPLDTNLELMHAIRRVIGRSVSELFAGGTIFGGTFMVKVPQTSTLLPLHQDWSIVEEDRHQTAFIWCPLVKTGPENGGLFLLPGSHRWFTNYRSGSMPSVRIVPRGTIRDKVEDIRLGAGEAIIYSDRLFHGSYANRTDADRVVITGRINEEGSRLVYYHRLEGDRVALVKASPEFYLKEIDALAKGELPPGYEILKTLPYRYRPVTEEDLLRKVS